MKATLRNKKVPSKMTFEVVPEGGGYSIYYCSDSDRKFIASAATHEDADKAVSKLSKTLGATEVKTTLATESYRVLGKINRRQLQVVAMELDPDRCWMFFEELLTLNYCLHIMVDCFDNLEELFGAAIDQGMKQHFKIAYKHVNALADAFLNSQIQGTADDYCIVNSKALYVKERIKPFIAYVMSNELEGQQWRLNELDNCLERILPESYLEESRQYVTGRMVNSFKGEEAEA